MIAAGEVDAGNLQIATVDVALVQSDTAVGCHLLVRAAPHRIVGAFHHRVTFRVDEGHRAFFRLASAKKMS